MNAKSPARQRFEQMYDPETTTVWPDGSDPAKRDDYCLMCSTPFADSDIDPEGIDTWAERAVRGVNATLCGACYMNSVHVPSSFHKVHATHEFEVYTYYPRPKHWPHDHRPVAINSADYGTEPLRYDELGGAEQQVVELVALQSLDEEYTLVEQDDIKEGYIKTLAPQTLGATFSGTETSIAVPDFPTPAVFTVNGVYTTPPEALRSQLGTEQSTNRTSRTALDMYDKDQGATGETSESSSTSGNTEPKAPQATEQQTLATSLPDRSRE